MKKIIITICFTLLYSCSYDSKENFMIYKKEVSSPSEYLAMFYYKYNANRYFTIDSSYKYNVGDYISKHSNKQTDIKK